MRSGHLKWWSEKLELQELLHRLSKAASPAHESPSVPFYGQVVWLRRLLVGEGPPGKIK